VISRKNGVFQRFSLLGVLLEILANAEPEILNPLSSFASPRGLYLQGCPVHPNLKKFSLPKFRLPCQIIQKEWLAF
jgi:hypothetical protein